MRGKAGATTYHVEMARNLYDCIAVCLRIVSVLHSRHAPATGAPTSSSRQQFPNWLTRVSRSWAQLRGLLLLIGPRQHPDATRKDPRAQRRAVADDLDLDAEPHEALDPFAIVAHAADRRGTSHISICR